MAQKFILLSVLWLVVAIFATSARAQEQIDSTDSPATATTGDVTTGDVTTGDATTGDATTGDATAGDATTGDATTGDATAGDATTGDATTGDATTGDATTGDATAGDATTGDATTATLTTSFKDPCYSSPCGTGSTCEARFEDDYVCLCLAGDSYNKLSNSCERSKVFPGNLRVRKAFKKEMTDTKSKEFIETANEIIAELAKVYNKKIGYSGSIVLELLPITTRVSRASSEVNASVQIIFEANSVITDDQVEQTLGACTDCNVIEKTFEVKSLCGYTPCDEKNTNCTSSDGSLSCTCKEGYKKTDYSTRMCIACPLGEKLKDNECVKCSFGYSGFNCSQNWQLILVIVGSVLGGLLLIAIILLPVVATQKSNKSFKKHKSAENEKQPMGSNKFGHSQGVSFNRSANGNSGFQSGGVPMFPRAANPTNSMDYRTNLEMNPSNGRQNFGHVNSGSRIYDEQDDIRPYAQTRPQNNPYAQNQPRMNPYTQNQGHSNPHYTHDDGRRYY